MLFRSVPTFALAAASVATAAAAPQASHSASEWAEFVELVCLDCHSSKRPKGGVDLEHALADPTSSIELWERAVRRVDAGEMPPDGGLDADEQVEWIGGLVEALELDPTDPGRPTLRRLTRAQLRNVLRDLLQVDIDVERFLPRDAAGYGFDTTGDTLFVSPAYFENMVELVEGTIAALGETASPLGIAEGTDPSPAVGEFVSRAFRRPATDLEIAKRVELFERAIERGANPRTAAQDVVRSTLLSPSFFYRVERDRPEAEGSWPIDGHELATRLSFFLWGTTPDEALRTLACSGELRVPEVLAAQVTRMLASPRSRWLAEDFAAQWLGFRELSDVTPDVRRFRSFRPPLRDALFREAALFFDDLVHADRSVLECLDSQHAFLNRRLAEHYGIEGVVHDDIRRVAIDDRSRGGVLGMGAILTITSTPLRTSPVQRGQWVLERLLGRPAPPPPPDAGSLPEDDRQDDGASLRERLERHRADPTCASCHSRMDPYGLAMESFDGIGRTREGGEPTDAERLAPPIDTAVVLPNGDTVGGPAELKAALARDPEAFVRTLTEALFVYATGRPVTLADRASIDTILERAFASELRFSSLVRGIVESPAFRKRRLDR